MDKFVPYEKLSKKKKRQLDAEKRGSWHGLKPITRKPKNPKAYDRKKARYWRDDSSNVLSSYIEVAPRFPSRQSLIYDNVAGSYG